MTSKSDRRNFTRCTLGMTSLAMLIVAAITLFSPTAAFARPAYESDIEYYSDGTYTNLVGESILFCNAMRWSWGIKTAYEIVTETPCLSGGGGVSSSNKTAPFVGPVGSFLAMHGDDGGTMASCNAIAPDA